MVVTIHIYMDSALGLRYVAAPKYSDENTTDSLHSVCALHGFLFGVLYAPVYALIAGLNFDGMKAWIITGIPWDITHGISNFVCGLLIVPIIYVLKHANRLSR